MHAGFWWKDLNEIEHLGDPRGDGRLLNGY